MMTLEEAVELLCYGDWLNVISEHIGKQDTERIAKAMCIVGNALRPVSRQQVEKAWTAEWTVDEFGHKCSKCGEYLPDGEDVRKPQFCPECGRAMTDEAVDMVMERLEALKDAGD